MPLKTQKEPSKNLTILTGEGELSKDDMIATLESLYEGSETMEKTIWDLRKATLKRIPSSEMKLIAECLGRLAWDRKEEKTAFVVETDLDYGIVRMYEGYTASLPGKRDVFRSLDEALDWLSRNS